MNNVVFLVQRLGPYHNARFDAASKELKRFGYELIVLELSNSDGIYAWDELINNGDFKRITLFKKNYDDLSWADFYTKITSTLNQVSPKAVFVPGWSSKEALISNYWANKNKVPRIIVSESSKFDVQRSFFKEMVKKYVLKGIKVGFVGGITHKDYLTDLGIQGSNIFLGYDAVDNSHFENNDIKDYDPDGIILASGRFIERKNFDGLIKAYAIYCKNVNKPKHLYICGSGEEELKLKTLVSTYKLNEKIVFPGFIQYESLPKYYKKASLFIIPSKSEQWGLVTNEAMAAGVPVLSSNLVGSSFCLIEDGINGFLFNPYDIKEMADKLIKFDSLPDDEKRKFSVRAIRKISEWGLGKYANGLCSSLNKAIKENE